MIQRAKASNQPVTPEIVAAFAALHMATDDGTPLAPAAHHLFWLRLICDPQINRLLIIGTPESAKTTWILAYIACMIGFYPEWPFIIAASSGPVAVQRSLALRNLVESAEYRATFPAVQRARGMSWQEDRWSVAEGGVAHAGRLHPTISSYGTGGAITGSRGRLIVGDDILDYENTRTQHQRQTVDNWLHNSLLSRVMAGSGRVILIGNAWHHDDSHARLRKNEAWTVCHIPLLSDGREVVATITYPDDFRGCRLGRPVAEAKL